VNNSKKIPQLDRIKIGQRQRKPPSQEKGVVLQERKY